MEFRILGPVDVVDDGRAIPLDGAKQRTVLAALLLAGGRLMPDDRLSALLWGWEPPATRNAQLYTYVSRLRGRLGPQVALVRKAPGYRLDLGPATLDLHAFERTAEEGHAELAAGRHDRAAVLLRTALSHWRGTPLAGTTEHLADREAPRLEELRLAALEHRVEADLELGRHDELVPELLRLVAEFPVRERLRGQLMTALHRCGRQADALGVYDHGRLLLAEDLGVDPGAGLQAIHRAILRDELPGPAAAQPPAVVTPAPPDPAAPASVWTALRPAMLPADTPDFTGRADELAVLAARLRVPAERVEGLPRPAAPVTVVTGPAGTGKSALVVRAARLARAEFPDGQLYADLRGRDERPKSPADVLGWLLRALGADGREIPDGLDERAQLFRSRLAGRRMLLVLDDAADDGQVRPLLPGAERCRTVVTSRDPLAGLEGSRALALGPLDFPDAYQLLSAVTGPDRVSADPASAARIVELCDRLPLALRICAARLAAHPHWTPATLADRLTPVERRLDELRLGALDVRQSLVPSHRGLAPAARSALRRLALAEAASFTAREAALLLEAGEEAAEEVLEALAEARLLTVAEEPRPRFRFAPLVRLFAREATEAVEAAEAGGTAGADGTDGAEGADGPAAVRAAGAVGAVATAAEARVRAYAL